jgi:thiol-disulfide isomerase/thioredoxin
MRTAYWLLACAGQPLAVELSRGYPLAVCSKSLKFRPEPDWLMRGRGLLRRKAAVALAGQQKLPVFRNRQFLPKGRSIFSHGVQGRRVPPVPDFGCCPFFTFVVGVSGVFCGKGFLMNRGRRLLPALVFLVAVSLLQVVADDAAAIKLGDVCPGFVGLQGVDGRRWSLDDFADKPVLVLCFTCNSCPYSVDYEERLLAFAKKYAGVTGDVALVAVNSNRKPSETLEKMGERAKQRGFTFPYVMDESQQLAASCGAVYTPEFFVFGRDRRLIYKGAMDDRTKESEVQERHVERAVEAALKGELPEVQEVPARGCAIPYRRSRR